MKLKVSKVNDFEVKLPLVHIDPKIKWKGDHLFSHPFLTTFLCAKSNSGKTSVIYNIIKECTDNRTQVYIFSPTSLHDKMWGAIQDYLKSKKYYFHVFTEVKVAGTSLVKVLKDVLLDSHEDEEADIQRLVDALEGEGEIDSGDERPELDLTKKCKDTIKCPNERVKKQRKKKEPPYKVPRILCIFDDLSSQLRGQEFSDFCKLNRHTETKVIFSSQFCHDISPSTWQQLGYVLIFKGIGNVKLKEIYDRISPCMSFDQFQSLYEFATKDKYNFFYISLVDWEYRKNFNLQLNAINSDDDDNEE